jgi:hypothetical protein
LIPSLAALAARAGVDVRYLGRLLRLAFLAPPLVERITQGRHPAGLTLQSLILRTALQPEWEAQMRVLQ